MNRLAAHSQPPDAIAAGGSCGAATRATALESSVSDSHHIENSAITPSESQGREFEGLTVVITGASSGIGRSSAELFARAGARLVLVGRHEARLSEVAAAIVGIGAECALVVGDVVRPETAAQAHGLALDRFGRIDVLVNNAGMALMKNLPETSLEEWRQVIDTNLTSVYLFSRLAIPAMRTTGGGSIVNVASEAGVVGFKGYAAYSASKAGIVNLTRAMALDHAGDRIRVNSVCPGSIQTPLLEQYYASFSDPAIARRDDELVHPLGIGRPIDVAHGILFLASPRAQYITGHALIIDGGYTAA